MRERSQFSATTSMFFKKVHHDTSYKLLSLQRKDNMILYSEVYIYIYKYKGEKQLLPKPKT